MTRHDAAVTTAQAGPAPDLGELAAYVDRVTRALADPQRAELAAALRRVWLRNRLPESILSSAVRDIADHCELATIVALAGLGVVAHPRVDPQPLTAWDEPVVEQDAVGWSLL